MTPSPPSEESLTAAVHLEDVSRTFRSGRRTVKALDEITVTIRPGVVTGLIGPDAAGKTTLMRLITGLILPDSGRIHALGMDVLKEPLQVQHSVGYMPQRFGLYEDLTVQENLDLYADLQGLAHCERPDRYQELTGMTGLGPFTGRLARDLSGGMKQKLGLACTLVHPPELLLLDEPTVGVDPVSRRELWAIVYRLVEQEGMTVLLSTSYLDEAERCQEVVLLYQGRLLGQGSPGHFSRRVAGRSFQAVSSSLDKRSLQQRLLNEPGVVDAIIHGGGVRVVMERPSPPQQAQDTLTGGEITLSQVEPRFEDSFILLLKKEAGPITTTMDVPTVPGSNEGRDIIVVQDVTRRFGSFRAVDGISFKVRQGEVFGLLGANGAGKSTTFRMLCGLLPVSEGRLQVAGEDLRRAAARARSRIGYMAQRFSLYGDLSVRENLAFFSKIYGLKGSRQQERVRWAMSEFDLAPFADATSAELPLGFKQRLALAAALMHSPEILFLDEPTSGVDPLARREFWYRINALAEQGVTILVTTHFMEEAEYCDRLVIMAEGKILAEGTPEKMKERFRRPGGPEPSMEDTFIALIEGSPRVGDQEA